MGMSDPDTSTMPRESIHEKIVNHLAEHIFPSWLNIRSETRVLNPKDAYLTNALENKPSGNHSVVHIPHCYCTVSHKYSSPTD